MNHIRRHTSRGQAVLETAIAIPLFLIGLFGVMWAYRSGMLAEQVQQSVRYGGLVSALSNPYEQLSLYSVYATIDEAPPPHERDCVGGSAGVIAQGHSAFWQPGTAPVQTAPTCGLAIIYPSSGVSYPVFLFSDYVSASTVPQTSGILGNLTFGNAPASASQNFFRPPDVGILLTCSHLGFAVKLSLEGDGDPISPTTVPSPFPQTVTPTATDVIPTGVPSNCYTAWAYGYGGTSAPY